MLSEQNILKSLDHANIVSDFEFFQEVEQYIVVTECLPKGELFETIKKLQIFSERMAADYIKQILQTVSYCHEKQLSIEILKPKNILLSEQGEEIKVIDFGTS
ncbi:unnamed protein product (macronuclear) [Paramecium tetraurelia]|uniref:Protein kinase domain-containing protein n=1 Tax=Paramecium tetraurelia TaxID=5888 RepID=A0BE98_PARTE|nr:uncharacterized protein GSPATT00027898001 [Paramecium tetraurelia]CAK56865.1 unnamed protein product [Paramecium tetraurelia]|eukprot:XP_001424263.1 hypothetical protein (macronuclear) [Paramecium tetraurelia strain d4-2]